MHPRSEVWHYALQGAREDGAITADGLAEQTSIPLTTIHDVLNQMCEAGWLVKIGHSYQPSTPVAVSARPPVAHR